MSQTIEYQITFFSDWHCGSGLSGGFGIDQLVILDKNGLPFIPGRTLKGLLRDAAENLSDLDQPNQTSWNIFINKVFGTKKGAAEVNYITASCFFSDGQLPADIRNHLSDHKDLKHFIFRESSSTAIDRNGLATEHSLRVKQTVIPLTIMADISSFPGDDDFENKLSSCMKWIKRLGVNRNRGLGRCCFEIVANGGDTA